MHNRKEKNILWSALLAVLSAIYIAVIYIRNFMYDIGIKRSRSFDVPTICVGNITVGGTGKTPVTEHLLRLLSSSGKVAMLSRGYKRTSKGFQLATSTDSYKKVGDEPMQMKLKYPNSVVAVDSNRCRGISKLLHHHPDLHAIVLDDAFQHRRVKPGLSILLTDYTRMIFEDSPLPLGMLREPFSAKERAQIVIVTKCPEEMRPIDIRLIIKKLELRPYQTLFFSSIRYGKMLPAFGSGTTAQPYNYSKLRPAILLVTGIAVNTPLVDYLQSFASELEVIEYRDHHNYTKADITHIHNAFAQVTNKNKIIVTTEKDMIRLREHSALTSEMRAALYYIPIEINILYNRETEFNNLIHNYVRTNTRISSVSKK